MCTHKKQAKVQSEIMHSQNEHLLFYPQWILEKKRTIYSTHSMLFCILWQFTRS